MHWSRRLKNLTWVIRSITGSLAFSILLSYWLVYPHIEWWQFFNRQGTLWLRERFSSSFFWLSWIFDFLWPIELLLAIYLDIELFLNPMKNRLPIQSRVKWLQLIKCLIIFLFNLVSAFDALLLTFEMGEKLSQARVEILKSLNELLDILRCRILQVVFYMWVKSIKLAGQFFEKSWQIGKFSIFKKLWRLLFRGRFLTLIYFTKFILQLIDFWNRRALNRL